MPGGDDDEMFEVNPKHWTQAVDEVLWDDELSRKDDDDD